VVVGRSHIPDVPALADGMKQVCCLAVQVHGDPHVMGFGYAEGGMLTCDATKEVDLLSNKFLCIRAEAQELVQSVANSSVSVQASIKDCQNNIFLEVLRSMPACSTTFVCSNGKNTVLQALFNAFKKPSKKHPEM